MSPLRPLVKIGGRLYDYDGHAGPADPVARFQPGDMPVPGVNVGVISGVNRATINGDLDLTSADNGTAVKPNIIDNLDVTGQITLASDCKNIIVRNVRVLMGVNPYKGTTNPYCGIQGWGSVGTRSNVIFEDIEIAPTVPDVGLYGIYAWDATFRRVYVHDCTDLINIYHTNAVFEGAYLERSIWWSSDPRQTDGAHNDVVQIHGGSGHVLRDVVFDCGIGPDATRTNGSPGANFSIVMTNVEMVTGLTVERGHFRGNPFSHIQTGDISKGAMTGIVIKDADFSDSRNANIRMSPETKAATTFTNLTAYPSGAALPASEIEGATSQR